MEGLKNQERRESNRKIIEKFRNYLKQGYLLHGSKSDALTLEPRQAHDSNPERVAGKAKAIYAEPADMRIPIFMALRAPKDPLAEGGFSSGYSAYGPNLPMHVRGSNLTFTPGFIHVLPEETFEIEQHGEDREYLSQVPVTAVEVIRVEPSLLGEFGDIEIDLKD